MGDPADLVARTAFPGRVRVFQSEEPGHAAALAVGCAWCERPRGGHAVAVVPEERRGDPLVAEALALAARLQLHNLVLTATGNPALPGEPLAPRERQPVRLASLGRDLVPRWRVATVAEALAETATHEPRLLLPARDPRWGANRAALLALAWIAGDGWRVAWELAAGSPLGAWQAELALIGRMQLPLKLLVAPGDLPWPPAERGLGRWWVAMPGEEATAGALAWTLAGEEAALLALAGRCGAAAPWLPGTARRQAAGEAGTVLSLPGRPRPLPPPGYGALEIDGLLPLPAALAGLPAPLLTADEDLARHLAGLDPRLRCTLAPPAGTPHSRR